MTVEDGGGESDDRTITVDIDDDADEAPEFSGAGITGDVKPYHG